MSPQELLTGCLQWVWGPSVFPQANNHSRSPWEGEGGRSTDVYQADGWSLQPPSLNLFPSSEDVALKMCYPHGGDLQSVQYFWTLGLGWLWQLSVRWRGGIHMVASLTCYKVNEHDFNQWTGFRISTQMAEIQSCLTAVRNHVFSMHGSGPQSGLHLFMDPPCVLGLGVYRTCVCTACIHIVCFSVKLGDFQTVTWAQ